MDKDKDEMDEAEQDKGLMIDTDVNPEKNVKIKSQNQNQNQILQPTKEGVNKVFQSSLKSPHFGFETLMNMYSYERSTGTDTFLNDLTDLGHDYNAKSILNIPKDKDNANISFHNEQSSKINNDTVLEKKTIDRNNSKRNLTKTSRRSSMKSQISHSINNSSISSNDELEGDGGTKKKSLNHKEVLDSLSPDGQIIYRDFLHFFKDIKLLVSRRVSTNELDNALYYSSEVSELISLKDGRDIIDHNLFKRKPGGIAQTLQNVNRNRTFLESKIPYQGFQLNDEILSMCSPYIKSYIISSVFAGPAVSALVRSPEQRKILLDTMSSFIQICLILRDTKQYMINELGLNPQKDNMENEIIPESPTVMVSHPTCDTLLPNTSVSKLAAVAAISVVSSKKQDSNININTNSKSNSLMESMDEMNKMNGNILKDSLTIPTSKSPDNASFDTESETKDTSDYSNVNNINTNDNLRPKNTFNSSISKKNSINSANLKLKLVDHLYIECKACKANFGASENIITTKDGINSYTKGNFIDRFINLKGKGKQALSPSSSKRNSFSVSSKRKRSIVSNRSLRSSISKITDNYADDEFDAFSDLTSAENLDKLKGKDPEAQVTSHSHGGFFKFFLPKHKSDSIGTESIERLNSGNSKPLSAKKGIITFFKHGSTDDHDIPPYTADEIGLVRTITKSVIISRNEVLMDEITRIINETLCPKCDTMPKVDSIRDIVLEENLYSPVQFHVAEVLRTVSYNMIACGFDGFTAKSSIVKINNVYGKEELTNTALSGLDLIKIFMSVAKTGDANADIIRLKLLENFDKIWRINNKVHRHPDIRLACLSVFELIKPFAHIPTEKDEELLKASIVTPGNDLLAYGGIPLSVKLAINYSKIAIEKFMEGNKLDSFLKCLDSFKNKILENPEYKAVFKNFGDLYSELISENGRKYINLDGRSVLLQKLYFLFSNLYVLVFRDESFEKSLFELVEEFSKAYESLITSRSIAKVKNDLGKLFCDIFLDSNNNLLFKYVVIKDLTYLVKFWSKRISKIPIPRIEVHEKSTDFVIDNLVLQSTIIPKSIDITGAGNISLLESKNSSGTIKVKLSGINIFAQNVGWMYYRRKGILKGAAFGLSNVTTKKESGISVIIEVAPRLRKKAIIKKKDNSRHDEIMNDADRNKVVLLAANTVHEMGDNIDAFFDKDYVVHVNGYDDFIETPFDDDDNAMPRIKASRNGLIRKKTRRPPSVVNARGRSSGSPTKSKNRFSMISMSSLNSRNKSNSKEDGIVDNGNTWDRPSLIKNATDPNLFDSSAVFEPNLSNESLAKSMVENTNTKSVLNDLVVPTQNNRGTSAHSERSSALSSGIKDQKRSRRHNHSHHSQNQNGKHHLKNNNFSSNILDENEGENKSDEKSNHRQEVLIPKLDVIKVKCDLRALKFDIISHRKNVLHQIYHPLAVKRVRKVLERYVERFVIQMITSGNSIIKSSVMNQIKNN